MVKGVQWLLSTWEQSCFSTLSTGHSNISGCLINKKILLVSSTYLFVSFVVCVYNSLVLEEKRRTKSSVSCFCGESLRHLNSLSNLFIVGCTLHTHQYTLHIVDIVYCTHVRHVDKNISEFYAPIRSQLQLL